MLYIVMLLPTHTASTVMLAATMVIMPATVPLESVMLMLMLMLMLHIITLLLLPTTHPEATTVMLAATTTLESVMLMLMLLTVMLLPTHTASTVMLAATMVILPATVPLESVMLMLMLMLYIITLLLLLPTLLDMDIDRMATTTRDKSEVRCCSYSSHASPAPSHVDYYLFYDYSQA